MSAKPKTFDDLYPGRFLKASSFQGRRVTLTIADYNREELEGDDGKKHKAILTFRETPLQLVACKTNGICIREMFGPELARWIGRRVTFFPSEWNGEPCIRVWGSPELKQELEVEIKLPRRKAFTMRLRGPNVKAAPPPPPSRPALPEGDTIPPDEDPGTHPADREPGED